MSALPSLLLTLRTLARSRAGLQLEILALRHQQVLQRTRSRRLRLTKPTVGSGPSSRASGLDGERLS